MNATVAMLGSDYLGALEYGGFSLNTQAVSDTGARLAAQDIAATSDPVTRQSKMYDAFSKWGNLALDLAVKLKPVLKEEADTVAVQSGGEPTKGSALNTGLIIGGAAVVLVAVILLSKKRRR